jgi:uncharacterized iron-regulated membrane protein
MRLLPTLPSVAGFVRKMLAGHAALGLSMGAMIYVVCVSGTLAVMYPQFERWEQPDAAEFLTYTPEAVSAAAQSVMATATARAPDDELYISLPTAASPRLIASIGETSWIAHQDGSLQRPAQHDWTHVLLNLHIYLHLENVVGLTLVGITGVMLFGLIASGLLAHPNILKDAFTLRWGASSRLRQTDLHNRLSVWGMPFHLAISLTGAFIGLSSVLVFLVAAAFYDGNRNEAGAPLFGAEPVANAAPAELPDIAAALTNLKRAAPELLPSFIAIEHPGTAGQQMTINTEVPRRLVYAERFLFAADGTPNSRLGLADGPIGKQIYASMYPIHFGSFGGLFVQVGYLLMGFALCVVTISGVNIWFAKRAQLHSREARLEALWTATTWGVPIGIAASALLQVGFGVPGTPVFWIALVACLAASNGRIDRERWSHQLRLICAADVVLIPIVHIARFGFDAFSPAARVINSMWLAFALGLCAATLARRRVLAPASDNISSVATAKSR